MIEQDANVAQSTFSGSLKILLRLYNGNINPITAT
jgi:hypothetical protein